MESDRERKIYGHTPLMAGCSLRLHRRAQRRVLLRARAQRRQPRRHRRQHPPLDGGGGDARVSIKSICVEYTNNTTRTDGAQYFGRGAHRPRAYLERPPTKHRNTLSRKQAKTAAWKRTSRGPAALRLAGWALSSFGPSDRSFFPSRQLAATGGLYARARVVGAQAIEMATFM